jgi:hypothetical protein
MKIKYSMRINTFNTINALEKDSFQSSLVYENISRGEKYLRWPVILLEFIIAIVDIIASRY